MLPNELITSKAVLIYPRPNNNVLVANAFDRLGHREEYRMDNMMNRQHDARPSNKLRRMA